MELPPFQLSGVIRFGALHFYSKFNLIEPQRVNRSKMGQGFACLNRFSMDLVASETGLKGRFVAFVVLDKILLLL